MNKTNIISGDTLKTMFQGALGAMSFGVYHQFTTNKMMELNNEKQNLLHKYLMDKHQNEIDELKERINKLNNISEASKKVWWY
jgi:replication initiation and membrane attachment protein DnaB